MEIISSSELRKYEEILEEINSEFEKCERLRKEIERADDKIVALKLSASPCKQKISHVNIKIFNHVSEIYNLYDDDVRHCDLQELGRHENCKFYLTEVFLTECLLQKLQNSQWKLQICVCCDIFSVCKVISLSDKTTVMEIIPVDSDIRECTLEISLFLCSDEGWNIIDLHTVNVDISYHFESIKDRQKCKNLPEMLVNITKLYNNDSHLTYMQPPIQIQNTIKCDLDNNFISSIIKNSYHRLDLELFSEFSNESKNVIDLQFCVSGKKIVILYNKISKTLKIKCCSTEMLLIKKFFVKQFFSYDYDKFRQKLKEISGKKNFIQDMDLNEIVLFYRDMRKMWL